MPRYAVVGAGPAGFYAASTLLKRVPTSTVDVLEALPVPFGLIRYGVAPDHPATKQAANTLSRVVEASAPRLRFFGNLPIGEDTITRKALARLYDHVVYATGADHPRRHPILPAITADDAQHKPTSASAHDGDRAFLADDFVKWINGHPYRTAAASSQYAKYFPNTLLDGRVAVVGMGNVSIDIARMLLRPVDDLVATDISPHALDAIACFGSSAARRQVALFGRRPPQFSKWTAAAVREVVTKIDGIQVACAVRAIRQATEEIGVPRGVVRGLKVIADNAARDLEQGTHNPVDETVPELSFYYSHDAVSLTSSITRNRTELRIRFRKHDLDMPQSSDGTKSHEAIHEHSCGLALLSLGYVGGTPTPGETCVGWANGSGRGIIGDNKWDAESVIAGLSDEQLRVGHDAPRPGVDDWIKASGREIVDWNAWLRIDAAERERGRALHPDRERVKFETVGEMLAAAR